MPELPMPEWEIGIPAIGQAAFEGGDRQEMNGPFVVLPEN
jgi:hypothetical protein